MSTAKVLITKTKKNMKCRIKVGKNCSEVIDFEQAANDVKHFVSVFGAKNVSIIFE